MEDLNYEETRQVIKREMLYLSEQEAKRKHNTLKEIEWRKTETVNSQFTHVNYAKACFFLAKNRNSLNDSSEAY